MESTGIQWKPLFNILEVDFKISCSMHGTSVMRWNVKPINKQNLDKRITFGWTMFQDLIRSVEQTKDNAAVSQIGVEFAVI